MDKKVPSVRDLIADDSHAATFQSLGQYRAALLREISSRYGRPAQLAASGEPVGQVCQRISSEPGLNGSVFYPGTEWLKAPPPLGTKLYTAPVAAQPSVPDGWKLVPDYKVGAIVKFGGEEYKIFAIGDRPGTFDICHPADSHRDRWLNVPPDALEPLTTAPTPPADGQAQQDNIRTGYPYDDPRFERLCIEHEIWGTAQSALCAVFWRMAQQDADKLDAVLKLIDEFRERLPSSFLTLVDAARAGKEE